MIEITIGDRGISIGRRAVMAGIAIVGLVLLTAGATYAITNQPSGAGAVPSEPAAHTTATATPSEDVQESREGAAALKEALTASGYENARVFIKQNGEVAVIHNSTADNGPALKDEMEEIAFHHSDVMAEYNETGGLTVQANGVTMMVPRDTAIAHANGDINDDAYRQTFHYESQEAE